MPKELWELNKTEQTITMSWGAVLHYGPRNISGSKEDMRDKYRGLNLDFVVDDEAAMGCDVQQYTNTLAAVRNNSDCRFYLTISTPKVGDYTRLIHSEKHSVFKGTSLDNPYLPVDYVDNMVANMSADQVRREIYAEEISLEGRIWKTCDITKEWPAGNLHPTWTKFRKGEPFWVFADLGGATGAYVVMQKADERHHGVKGLGNVWIAVADYCPHSDASATRAFKRIRDEFGIPASVVAGRDVNTRGAGDGKTVSYFAKQIWGNVNIRPVGESNADKQIQYDRLSYLMCSATGERRFTVARDFVALDPDSHRGVIEMINEDEWPEESKRRPTDVLPKNRECRVAHVRDACLMGSYAVMSPPSWNYTDEPPA